MTQLEDLMQELRLKGMQERWKTLQETRQTHELTLHEGLEIILHAEKEAKQNNRFERLVKAAKFRYNTSVEELSYQGNRGLSKDQIAQLISGQYMEKGEAILITGATGCGKSFIATALGYHACQRGKKVSYFNTQKLLLKTKMYRADGTIFKFFDKMARTDLIILDDFGLKHLENQQQQDFMEIIEDRHAKKSTIIASQLPVTNWYEIIGEETIADAILDRLVHTSHRIELKGESLRKIS